MKIRLMLLAFAVLIPTRALYAQFNSNIDVPSAEEIERINLTLEVEPQRPGFNPPYAGEADDIERITFEYRFDNPHFRLQVSQEKINSERFRREVLNPDFDLIVNKLVPDGSYKKPFIRYHQVHLQFSYSRYQCVPTRDLTGNLGNTPPFCSIFKFLPTLYGPFHLIENLPDGQLVVVPNFKRRARSRVVNYRVPGSNLKLQIRLKPEGEHANGFVTVIDTSGGSDQTIAENLAY